MLKAEKKINEFEEGLNYSSPSRSKKGGSDDLEVLLKDTNLKIRQAMHSLKWVTGDSTTMELLPKTTTPIELFEEISVHYKIPVYGQKGSCVVTFKYPTDFNGYIQVFASLTNKEPSEFICDKKKEGRPKNIKISDSNQKF